MEIQFIPEIDYFQRMLFGVSKTIVEHMFEGDEYIMVKKVYSINIVYFDLGHGTDYVYHGKTDFKGLHDNEILQLSDKQRKIFGQIEAGDLYPEYYVLKINNFNNVAATKLDEWIYFLKNDRIEDNFSAPGLVRARDILDYSRLSPEQQADYDHVRNEKSHYLSQIATAKYEGEAIGEAKAAKIIEEKSKAIEEQSKAIEEKDKAIEEQSKAIEKQSKAIEEKDKSIEEQSKEIAELKRLLNMK
jgi:DNA repair exonuclease SbcCD ATPase subunit